MTTGIIPFSWITSQGTRTEHAVSHDAQAASVAVGQGVYEPLCGAQFVAASMDVGPAGRCSSCLAFLRARAETRDFDARMEDRRPGWLSRLCSRRTPPAHPGRHQAPAPGAIVASLAELPASADRASSRHRRGRHVA